MPKKTSSSRKKEDKQNLRDLDLEISFMEGIVRRDPTYVDALQILGDDYTRRGRHDEGLKVDESLARLRPNDALIHYNLACSYSLTKQGELAISQLVAAIDLGYRDFKWLAKDPDLENVRNHPEYERVRNKIKTLKIKAQE